MHRLLLISAVLIAALASAGLGAPSRTMAEASDGEPFNRRPVTGTGADGTEFLGTLYVQRFAPDGERLVAIGSLSGQLTRTAGAVAQPVTALRDAAVRVPVTGIASTCEVLELEFASFRPAPTGPAVRADPIRLDGATEPGALSRNLRCSLAEQLGADAPSGQVATLLNGLLKLLA